MKARLQKILSARGVASRRKAEEMILAGRVSCNGITASVGDAADPEVDTILVDGTPLPSPGEYVYILLHKPKGYVTTMADEKGRKTVADLVADCPQRVYPVGRLDYDSEGLLLMTNDGAFANLLMHPRHEVDKTYEVWVTGFGDDSLALLRRPIELDGYRIKQPGIRLLRSQGEKAVIRVTIHEGRNRQVRRMCAAAGLRVLRLIRVSEGKLSLGALPSGTWRYLTQEEVLLLKK